MAPIRVARALPRAQHGSAPLIGKFLTVETPGTCDKFAGENEKPAEAGANWSLREEVSIFLSSTGFAAVAALSIAAAARETAGASGDH